jgi:hypothetical protein
MSYSERPRHPESGRRSEPRRCPSLPWPRAAPSSVRRKHSAGRDNPGASFRPRNTVTDQETVEPTSRREVRDAPFTTREAAAYLGYQTTGAIRKAVMHGRLVPLGRRGGSGCLMFSRAELDRFARGEPQSILGQERSAAPLTRGDHEQHESELELTRGSWISTEPILPGVWKRKEGGHVLRLRMTNPRTGKMTERARQAVPGGSPRDRPKQAAHPTRYAQDLPGPVPGRSGE